VTELRNTTGSFGAVGVSPAAINQATQALRQDADQIAAEAATLQAIAEQLFGDARTAINQAVQALRQAAAETAAQVAILQTVAKQLDN
jgi:hypothetical protein